MSTVGPSFAEREAEHTRKLAELTATRDKAKAEAANQLREAEAAFRKATTELETRRRGRHALELRLSRKNAIESLARELVKWREAPSVSTTEKVLAAFKEANNDARRATGSPVDERVPAFAMAEILLTKDPKAVLAFALPGAWLLLDRAPTQLLVATQNVTKLLAAGDVIEANAQLELLERAANHVARNASRLGDLEHAKQRWDVLKYGTPGDLEPFDTACEQKRQAELCSQLQPLRSRHPTDDHGNPIMTLELQRRIKAGRSPEEVLADAMRENAELGGGGASGYGVAAVIANRP